MFPFSAQLTYLKIENERDDFMIDNDLVKVIRSTYLEPDFGFRV